MSPRVEFPTDPVSVARRERYGLNNIAYSDEGLLATSDVRMNVRVQRGGEIVFARNFESRLDKVRPTDRVRGLAFSPDASRLYVAAGDTVYAVDAASGQTVWSYVPPRSFGFLVVSPANLAVSRVGDVAVSFDNGTLAVWSGEGEIRSMWQDNDAPRRLAYANEDRIVGTDSFSLTTWSVTTRQRGWRKTLAHRAFGFAVSPTGEYVVTRGLHDATIWEADSGERIADLAVGTGLPTLAFHPRRPILALGSRDGVEMVDFQGRSLRSFSVEGSSVVSLAISTDGGELAVGCGDDSLRRFPLDLP